MSTLDQAGLTHLLDGLSISMPALQNAGATVLSNPLDLCRTTLAEVLAGIVECDAQAAFRSVQWPNNIFNGDLSVTVPKLCPGRKPAEVSSQLVDKVRQGLAESGDLDIDACYSSPRATRSSIHRSLKGCICESF